MKMMHSSSLGKAKLEINVKSELNRQLKANRVDAYTTEIVTE
jgi:hypothetical protein